MGFLGFDYRRSLVMVQRFGAPGTSWRIRPSGTKGGLPPPRIGYGAKGRCAGHLMENTALWEKGQAAPTMDWVRIMGNIMELAALWEGGRPAPNMVAPD
ncbi:hypothetical protein AMTR_s00041p00207630 [Amborella trichopoda]|uniref:Uncharacterized protein n=1 Tax=Amborella trichopoda TaxID=13333 RepID=W1PZH1_AMBTC|nr:hypothetical protein AMTR_s00041p00207630 [Amborella trichopoda]